MDFLAHHEISPRMFSHGLHAHDYYEFYLHLGGGRFYCIDDTVFELQPNQLLVIPPLHMHGLVCDRDLVDYERCYLYLSTELMQRCGLGKTDLNMAFETFYARHKILKNLSPESALTFKQHVCHIEQTKTSGSDYSSMQYINIFTDIMHILQLAFSSLSENHDKFIALQPESPTSIQQVLHYINAHYTDNISVEFLHQHFHISSSLLSHKFKAYTGKGVYEYILYKRILKAKELMYSDLTLTEIAYRCGFNDYSNFLRVFKRITGSSPRDMKSTQPNTGLTE